MPTTTNVSLDLIDQARIASPCPMRWEDMEGTGTVRHCGQCSMNVYNFSEMSREEVERLLAERRDRLCGAFYRRSDGTILTRDCPVGLRAVRMRAAKMLGRVAAALGLLLTGGVVMGRSDGPGRLRTFQPFASLCERLAPTATPPPGATLALGKTVAGPTGPQKGAGRLQPCAEGGEG